MAVPFNANRRKVKVMRMLERVGNGLAVGVRIARAVCDKRNRSVPEWALDGLRRREEVRIAIVGAKKSGKTVLWTAVENYLRYLKASRSDTLGDWKVVEVEPREPFGWPNFDYGHVRAKLAETEAGGRGWPSETDKVWCRSLDVDLVRIAGRGSGARRKVCLRILDIPGERFSDLGTMHGLSFGEWSCELDRYWRETPSESSRAHAIYAKKVKGLLAELDRLGDGAESVLDQVAKAERACMAGYRDFLRDRRDSCSQFLTPSTYVMPDSSMPAAARELREDELYGDCGFVPLPKEAFGMKGRGVELLVKRFGAAYREYKANLRVDEIAKWLETANQAYYLVDVLAILQNGKSAKEGVESQVGNVGERLFSNRGDPLCKKAWKFLFKTQVSRFCAIVTQSDRTNVERDAGNLKKLCEGLFGSLFAKISGATTDCIVCSAVRSAAPFGENGELKGKFLRDRNRPTGPKNLWEGPYSPPVVPSDWKDAWTADGKWDGTKGWWLFPEPMGFPRDYDEVPCFYHLDDVVKSMVLPDEGAAS